MKPLATFGDLLKRLAREDGGQDLIEYALLTGIITSGLIALMPSIRSGMANGFTQWGAERNNLWIPPVPGP